MCTNCDNLVDMGFTKERFPVGTHMCLIYSSEAERSLVISRYLESGINGEELIAYFADKNSPDETVVWMQENGIIIDSPTKADNIKVYDAESIYCPNGFFDPEVMLDTLKSFYIESKKTNYKVARISGEMSWALKGIPGSNRLMEYESKVNKVLVENPITAICQYDVTKFDGATILECLKVHPFMIVRGQIVRNPYYLQPEEYLLGA